MIQYFHQIFYILGPHRRILPWLLLIFLGNSMLDLAGLGLVGPYVTLLVDPEALDGPLGRMVNLMGLPREQQPLLIILGLMLFGIFLLKAVLAIVIHWVIMRFSQLQQLRLRSFLMQSYQELPYIDYLRRNSSEYINNIQQLSAQFSGVITNLLQTTSNGIVGLVILALLAWTNGPALVLLVALLGMMVFSYDKLFRKKLNSYGEGINRANMQIVQGIHEGIEGLKEIRVLGNEKHFLKKVRDSSRQAMLFQIRRNLIQTAPSYLLQLIMVSFIVLLVFSMVYLDQDLKTLLPTLGVFGVGALRLLPSANMISGSLVNLRFSRDAVSRLYHDLEQLQSGDVHDTRSEEYELNMIKNNTNWKLEDLDVESEKASCDFTTAQSQYETFRLLEMRNLSFRYTNVLVDALQGINLQIRSGESVGIIGTSGAGKTTLIDMFLGLHEPQTGSITFNGRPLREALLDWRSQTAYLPQQVFLIDNTLKSNVALGVEDVNIDETRLHEALRKARLSELLKQLPNGVETLLGERGVRLSGGQRQRVALARAFYHARGVLVMDEATNALDDSTEREIVEEIKHLKGKITMIVIAHRLTTVQHCDRIYRLENGCMVEEGHTKHVLRQAV